MIRTPYLIGLALLGLVLIYLLFFRLLHDVSSTIWKIDPIANLLRKLDSHWEGEFQRFKRSGDHDLILAHCRRYGQDWKNDVALSNLFALVTKKGYKVRPHDIIYLIKQEIKLGNYHQQVSIKEPGGAEKQPGKQEFDYFKMMKKDKKP